jgi:hypothetical protein
MSDQAIPTDDSGAAPVMAGNPDQSYGGAIQTDVSDAAQNAQQPMPAVGYDPKTSPGAQAGWNPPGAGPASYDPAAPQGASAAAGFSPPKPEGGVGMSSEAAGFQNDGRKIKAMLMGYGAAPMQKVEELSQAVDPDGKLPQGDRNVLAIHKALTEHGEDYAKGIVQALRTQYQAKQSFAMAAFDGSKDKPPNISAAIDAANKAQADIPDGSNISFSASHGAGTGAVTATVSMAGSKEPQVVQLSPKAFREWLNVGGEGQFDHAYDRGSPAILTALAQKYPVDPTADQAPAAEQKPEEAAADKDALTKVSKDQKTADAEKKYNDAHGLEKRDDGETYVKDTGVKLKNVKRANEAFPWLSQSSQAAKYAQSLEGGDEKLANNVDVASEKGKNDIEKAKVTAGGKRDSAQIAADAKRDSAKLYSEAGKAKVLMAMQEKERMLNKTLEGRAAAEASKQLRTKIAQGSRLEPAEQVYWDKAYAHMNPAESQTDKLAASAGSSAPAPAAEQQASSTPPPANQRVAGQTTVTTNKGTFVWNGNGWDHK